MAVIKVITLSSYEVSVMTLKTMEYNFLNVSHVPVQCGNTRCWLMFPLSPTCGTTGRQNFLATIATRIVSLMHPVLEGST